jgi:mediator of RNA polymerase II transcription subunit 10
MAPNSPIKLKISMPPYEAPVPGNDMGGSEDQAANPSSQADIQDSETDTDHKTSPRKSKHFDNSASQIVHCTLKSRYAYRLRFKLPKNGLAEFPAYNGKIKEFPFAARPSLGFVSLKGVNLIGGRVVRVKTRKIEPVAPVTIISATSPPSLISVGLGTVTPFSQPATPVDGRIPVSNTPGGGYPGQDLLGVGQAHVSEAESDFNGAGRIRTKSIHDVEIAWTQDNVAPIAERILDCTRNTMAPLKDTSKDTTAVYNELRQVVNTLTDIQSLTHGYLPQTQDILVDRLTELTESLSTLRSLTSPTESASNPIHNVAVAPEIVDYVDDGRNPDIFTRDFVELVQRGNAVINGKQVAFRDFTEIYAQKLKEGIPGVSRQVDRVLDNARFSLNDHDRAKLNGALESVNGNGMMGSGMNGESSGH